MSLPPPRWALRYADTTRAGIRAGPTSGCGDLLGDDLEALVAPARRVCRTCRRQRVVKRGAPRGVRSRLVHDLAVQRAWGPTALETRWSAIPAQTSGLAARRPWW